MKRTVRLSLSLLLVATCCACTSIPPEQRTETDPWEPMNRSIYRFNDAVDKSTLRPLAKGYQAITPSVVRTGIGNFFDNLSTPASIINNFLQGKPSRGLSETARFVVNSTVGIGGLLDVATASGVEEYDEDFGQTAAVWGIPEGPFVMLPLLGPRNLRDALTLPLDMAANPIYHYDNSSVKDPLQVLRIVDLRYQLLTIEKLLDGSKDPYVTLRESYRQNREFEIFDGDPPEDEDDYFDEFLDEDEAY